MKNFLSLLLALILALSMVGCDAGKNDDIEHKESQSNVLGTDAEESQSNNLDVNAGTEDTQSKDVIEPYHSYCWVGAAPKVFYAEKDKCLNPDKIVSDSPHLPIFKCESQSDLEEYIDYFPSIKWDEAPSFNEIAANIDTSLFDRQTIFIVYINTNSGSYRFGVDSYSVDNGTFSASIIQTNDPKVCTEDEAGWLIIFSVSKKLLIDVEAYDAIEITKQ